MNSGNKNEIPIRQQASLSVQTNTTKVNSKTPCDLIDFDYRVFLTGIQNLRKICPEKIIKKILKFMPLNKEIGCY